MNAIPYKSAYYQMFLMHWSDNKIITCSYERDLFRTGLL